MNILLTGGAGYIGSNASHSLIEKGSKVTIIDNLENGDKNLVPDKAALVKTDISNTEEIKKVIKNNKFDVVMHFAAYTKVGESVKYPDKYIKNNYEKAKIFVNTCLENGLNKVILSSTGAVYGNIEKNLLNESDDVNPLNPYSISKFKLETYFKDLSSKKKLSSIILRYFNVCGADEYGKSGLKSNPDNLIKVICEVALKKRSQLIINGKDYNTKDGTTIRDYIHVSDLVEMHILAAQKLLTNQSYQTEIYNCGYGKGFSILDIVNNFNSILDENIRYKFGERRKGDAERSVADNSKFVKDFNWKPKHNDLKYILKTALNWEKKI
tara:strand:+ start:2018 stop:2992 length:975 start_codon:yes stop_codon:yes gene_type:complete